MTIAVLACLSLLLMLAAFAYLTYKDFTGETFGSKIASAVKSNRKIVIYLTLEIMIFMVELCRNSQIPHQNG